MQAADREETVCHISIPVHLWHKWPEARSREASLQSTVGQCKALWGKSTVRSLETQFTVAILINILHVHTEDASNTICKYVILLVSLATCIGSFDTVVV